ncbi:hypothetical protein [Glaciimonas sp. PCH181]|uniref:hypothetical protein n=1 Tax=Glaciimonas sp. PCH181 TaxID=2133943 RepID=UPI000D35D1FB|nr:hypothetical protein [Glaciimonas sp. PCH181]PUA17553.1 hypothetical protein C7W93_16830 [Glaciimonas sp. PCH181]
MTYIDIRVERNLSDGHAKKFSIHLKQGGAYALTSLYDILSAYPVIGVGKTLLSPHKVKLAKGEKGKYA